MTNRPFSNFSDVDKLQISGLERAKPSVVIISFRTVERILETSDRQVEDASQTIADLRHGVALQIRVWIPYLIQQNLWCFRQRFARFLKWIITAFKLLVVGRR